MKTSDHPDAALLGRCYEEASRAYTVAVTRAGGGAVFEDDDFTLTILPHAHNLNGVISPCFSDARADERIETAMALARRYQERIRFKLGPSSQPADLARRLEAHGLKRTAGMKYYGMEIRGDLPNVRLPDGLRIYRVEDFDSLLFEPHPFYGKKASPRKRALMTAFGRLALECPRRLNAFAAEMHGHFAGMAVTFIHEDVVIGCDFVVVKALRRRGIGAAMLMHMGRFVQSHGARRAALLSSTQGLKFYPQFGFQPVGIYPTYTYIPAVAK